MSIFCKSVIRHEFRTLANLMYFNYGQGFLRFLSLRLIGPRRVTVDSDTTTRSRIMQFCLHLRNGNTL